LRAHSSTTTLSNWKPEWYQRPPACAGLKGLNEKGKRVILEWPCIDECKAPDRHPRWRIFLLLGGRGSGKTETGGEASMAHARKYGSHARIGVMAPTIGASRDVCAEGPSGIISKYREEFITYNRSLGEAVHASGAYFKFEGSEEPDRWNGGNWTMLWPDEIGLINWESFKQARFALRLKLPDGSSPYIVATGTPKNNKNRKVLEALSLQDQTATFKVSTKDNPHLDEQARQDLYDEYGGTRLGRQELEAEFIDDVEGALWTHDMIDDHRRTIIQMPELLRVGLAIDPSGTANRRSNETGIVIGGIDTYRHIWIRYMWGKVVHPSVWGRKVATLYDDEEYAPNYVIAETNYGGEMVKNNIRNFGEGIPVRMVNAAQGKRRRAEPIATMYEQGKVHHVGEFPIGEDQMCSFIDEDENDGDGIVDALVWLCRQLSGKGPRLPAARMMGPRVGILNYKVY
jgi:phage terminase large subunit-like protein